MEGYKNCNIGENVYTEIGLKPEAEFTVNLPTWVWLDKCTFQEVKVRAELPGTNRWAKPVTLHLEPGTEDAETYPASGVRRHLRDHPGHERPGNPVDQPLSRHLSGSRRHAAVARA
ncbi:hypothetical protein [Streptomyces phaeochromogenes]|uniref:hypothetical protein n=1 Tax=Streptomyces phaeochromogenes TaxID=1923 RepID=UPI00386E6E3D